MQRIKIIRNLIILLTIASILPVIQIANGIEKKSENESVILLHGMGRSYRSMRKMEKFLQKKGYSTININYPSTSLTVEEISTKYIEPAIKNSLTAGSQKIHFVTHSLGGIVIRQYLQNHTLPLGSRVVMLAPPNNGSEVADYLRGKWWYSWMMGPAGQCLGTGSESLPNSLSTVDVEIGIIAGTRSYNPLFSMWLEGNDDGKVSVASTKLSGMTDFLTIPASHPFIMRDKTVLAEVEHFLVSGRFSEKKANAKKES